MRKSRQHSTSRCTPQNELLMIGVTWPGGRPMTSDQGNDEKVAFSRCIFWRKKKHLHFHLLMSTREPGPGGWGNRSLLDKMMMLSVSVCLPARFLWYFDRTALNLIRFAGSVASFSAVIDLIFNRIKCYLIPFDSSLNALSNIFWV